MRDISTIVGLEVIGIADGKVVGKVSEVVCDLASGRLLGLIVGEGAAEKGVSADDIVTIGDDAVMIPASDAAKRLSEMEELMRYRRPEGKALEVVTDDGRRIGRVVRVWIDPYEKKVTRYEVSRGMLQDVTEGRTMMPVVPGSVHGEDTIIVPAAAAMELAGHGGGLKEALRKLSQRVKEQSAAARERAEEAARAARERVQKAVEAAKEAGESPAGEAAEKAEAPQPCECGEEAGPCQGEAEGQAPGAQAAAEEEQVPAEGQVGEESCGQQQAGEQRSEEAEPCGPAPCEGEGREACGSEGGQEEGSCGQQEDGCEDAKDNDEGQQGRGCQSWL